MSELGKILDPLADKILLVSVFITLAALGIVPVWLAVTAVARDVTSPPERSATTHFCYGYLQGRPTLISKINTLCQILYLLLAVAAKRRRLTPQTAIIDSRRAGVRDHRRQRPRLRHHLFAQGDRGEPATTRTGVMDATQLPLGIRLPDSSVFASYFPGRNQLGRRCLARLRTSLEHQRRAHVHLAARCTRRPVRHICCRRCVPAPGRSEGNAQPPLTCHCPKCSTSARSCWRASANSPSFASTMQKQWRGREAGSARCFACTRNWTSGADDRWCRARRRPRRCRFKLADLASRLNGGVVLTLQPLDEAGTDRGIAVARAAARLASCRRKPRSSCCAVCRAI